jgi:spermidine synthase
MGKTLLPWFGGSPSIWTTSMMFFQAMLAGGYYYSYWLTKKTDKIQQRNIHISLATISITALILLGFTWGTPSNLAEYIQSTTSPSPELKVVIFLAVAIGMPYLLLASNSPLIQLWHSKNADTKSYSRLYALSNTGSLLGLLTYPFIIEPHQSVKYQAWTWSVAFICLCAITILICYKHLTPTKNKAEPLTSNNPQAGSKATTGTIRKLWIYLSFTSSLLLTSVTNQISQEIAVIPLLWILPLSLYLLSFILIYSRNTEYNRTACILLVATSLTALTYLIYIDSSDTGSASLAAQITAYCLFLLAACLVLHGELHILRPAPSLLTNYYLMISLGGMLGGIFSGLLSPHLFNGYWELWIAIALAIVVCLHVLRASRREDHDELSRSMLIIFLFSIAAMNALNFVGPYLGTPYSERNFFGVVRVTKQLAKDSGEPILAMSHGRTIHGTQFLNPTLKNTPTTYYVSNSGIGVTLLHHPRRGMGLKVGLIGLGIGTIASYGLEGDDYRLYEINPDIIDLAEGYHGFFSYLTSTKAKLTTISGDARISLKREFEQGQPAGFDVLILDAFSSDSIPIHLLTKEAFSLYMGHLSRDGVIAAHISNLHLDLTPVFWRLANLHGLHMIHVRSISEKNSGYPSDWLLLTNNLNFLNNPEVKRHATGMKNYTSDADLWTDDFSNIFQIIK